jgi:hypothetical protein
VERYQSVVFIQQLFEEVGTLVGVKRFGINVASLFEGLQHLPVADGLPVEIVLTINHDVHGQDVQPELFFESRWKIRRTVANQSNPF